MKHAKAFDMTSYPITRKVDQKCLGKNTNQLQGKNLQGKIQTKYKRE